MISNQNVITNGKTVNFKISMFWSIFELVIRFLVTQNGLLKNDVWKSIEPFLKKLESKTIINTKNDE